MQFLCGVCCHQCAAGAPLLVNSEGFYSHSENGNHCSNHRIYKAFEDWQLTRRASAPAPAPRTYTAEEVDAVILEVFATHYWHGAVGERHSFGGFRNYVRARLEGKEPHNG
jgi:hypothetical protein